MRRQLWVLGENVAVCFRSLGIEILLLFCSHVSVTPVECLFMQVRIRTPGGRDCREQSDCYEAADNNCASIGIEAETFTDEILCVATSTLYFIKLF